MESTKEQVQAWLNDPITKEILKQLDDGIAERQAEVRYTPLEIIDGVTFPTTSDMCALKCAYQEGRIIALKEIIDIMRGDDTDES